MWKKMAAHLKEIHGTPVENHWSKSRQSVDILSATKLSQRTF